MSLTKQQLQQLNNTNFPNNTTGYITPALLRDFNSQSVDSMALQSDLDTFSASVSTNLDNLNEFSSSLVTNFATVAQLNASSSTIEAQIDTLATTSSVSAVSNSLYVFQSDQSTVNTNVNNRFTADETKFNAYTQSTNLALGGKASLSQDNYFVGNQYVDGKVTVDGNISSSGDIRAVGNVYGANLTGSFVSSSTFSSFSSSVSTQFSASTFFSGTQYKNDSSSFDSRINGIVIGTGYVSTGSFNSYTASNDTKVNNLNTISASYLAFTQSYYSDSSSFSSRIEAIDDDNVTTASFNSYTSSNDSKVNSLIAATASYAISSSVKSVTDGLTTTSSFNTYTSSTNSRLNSVESFTASVSTSVGLLQTFSGSQYKTDSSSFDSRINNISAPVGFVTTASFNAYTQSNDTKVNNLTNATSSYAISSSVKVVTDSLQTQINGLATTASVNTLSTSVDSRLDSLETAGYVTSAITASSIITASVSQSTITFTKGNGSTFNIVVADVSGAAGNFVTTSSFNSYTASQDFKNTTFATTESFNAYTQSTNNFTASISTSVGLLQTFSASADSRYVQNSQTSSMAVSSSLYSVTSSYAVSATNANDILVYVKNTTGFQINKGKVVRITSAVGDNALIGTASWDNDSTSANTLGFVTENIANDAFGYVMTQGTLLGVNTDGFTAGQVLYLSASGDYTVVVPPAPYHEVRLGQVLRAQLNNGSIYVTIQNGYELGELHDVNIVSASNNDLLAYNSASGQWENKSFNTLGLATTSSVNALTQSINNNSSSIGLLQTFSSSQYKADSSSFDSRINSITGSGGIINTGSFATTGSNTFVGQQTIQNNLVIEEAGNPLIYTQITQDSLTNKLQVNQAGASGIDFNVNVTMNELTASLQQGYVWVGGAGNVSKLVATSSFIDTPINTGSFAITGSNIFYGNQVISGSSSMSYGLDVTNGIKADYFYTDGQGVFTPTLYGATVGLGKLQIEALDGVNINGHLTASLQEGYVWVGDSTGKTTTVSTSSFGGGGTINTGSLVTTSSFNAYTASQDFKNTTFATTGSNTFVGDQYISNGVLQVATYPQTSKQWFSPTAIEAIGTASVAYEQFIDGGGYDAFNVITTLDSGSQFRDLRSDTFALETWLEIPRNTGNNPAPQFKRGLGVTGSLSVNGSTSFSELTGSLASFSASVNNRFNLIPTINTSSFATTGSNNFIGNQTITGSVNISGSTKLIGSEQVIGVIQAADADYGPQWASPTVFQGVGASAVAYQQFVANGNFDCVNIQSNINAGSDFQDLRADNFALVTWLNIPTNTGNNPKPQFKRGLAITGSTEVTADITASKILLTDTGTTAIQYNQQSSGSVAGQFATSYGKDNIKVYQYQGQPYAFNVNLTANQANAYTGSQFEWGLQLNGSNVSLPGGGGIYFAMVSGSTTGSGGGGADKLGLNYLGTAMILDNYADASFRRRVYVDKGMFVSQSVGGSQVGALTVDGTNAANSKAIVATGSVDITGSLTVNGTSVGLVGYGSYYTTTTNSGSVLTFLTEESAVGFENVSGSYIRTTQSGVFQVIANVSITSTDTIGTATISLKKNGSTITATEFGSYFSNASSTNSATTNAIVSLNANDYIEVGLGLLANDTATVGRVSIVRIA